MRPSRATLILAWSCLSNLLAADMMRAVDDDVRRQLNSTALNRGANPEYGVTLNPDESPAAKELMSAYFARDLAKEDTGLPPEKIAAGVLQRALDSAVPKGLTAYERARLAYGLTAALGYLGDAILNTLPERNSPGYFPPLKPGEVRAAYLVRASEWAKRSAREVLHPAGGGTRVARNVGWFYGYCVAGQSLRQLAATGFPDDHYATDAKGDRHTQVRAGISVAADILQVKVRWRSAQGDMG